MKELTWLHHVFIAVARWATENLGVAPKPKAITEFQEYIIIYYAVVVYGLYGVYGKLCQ